MNYTLHFIRQHLGRLIYGRHLVLFIVPYFFYRVGLESYVTGTDQTKPTFRD